MSERRMIPLFQIEAALINAIETPEHLQAVEDAHPLFSQAGPVYLAAREYWQRFGTKPPLDVLRVHDTEWPEPSEAPFDFWLPEWVQARKVYGIRKAMNDAL